MRVIADDVMVKDNPLSFTQPILAPGCGGKCDCVDRSLTDMCQDCTRLQTNIQPHRGTRGDIFFRWLDLWETNHYIQLREQKHNTETINLQAAVISFG